jgi:cation diffusion facilitator CzcD-associated flavoprotein CzcO
VSDAHPRTITLLNGDGSIYVGVRIPQVFGDKVELQIYDKNKGVGGTWHENKYPGCACDVPSHRYCYTFENNPDFLAYYSDADAIEDYLVKTWRKYGVDKLTQLNTAVVKALWNEDSGKWDLTLKGPSGEFTDSCDVLLNATGILNAWKWPDIQGLKDFKGKLLHTAAYDRSVETAGKRVAVIGTGCVTSWMLGTAAHSPILVLLASNAWLLLRIKWNGWASICDRQVGPPHWSV